MQNYFHHSVDGAHQLSIANNWNELSGSNSSMQLQLPSLQHDKLSLEELDKGHQRAMLPGLGITSYLQQLEYLKHRDICFQQHLIYNAAIARAKMMLSHVPRERLDICVEDLVDSALKRRIGTQAFSFPHPSAGHPGPSDGASQAFPMLPRLLSKDRTFFASTSQPFHDLIISGSNPETHLLRGKVLNKTCKPSINAHDEMSPNRKSRGKKKLKMRVVKHKQKNKPKRPLSAYNIFFKDERAKLLAELPGGDSESKPVSNGGKKSPHRKIGFEDLAKIISQRWHSLDPEKAEYYKSMASSDMSRYKGEMKVFEMKQLGSLDKAKLES